MLGDPLKHLASRNSFFLMAAFGFGVVTSALSGLSRAWMAAHLNPVDVLRR